MKMGLLECVFGFLSNLFTKLTVHACNMFTRLKHMACDNSLYIPSYSECMFHKSVLIGYHQPVVCKTTSCCGSWPYMLLFI